MTSINNSTNVLYNMQNAVNFGTKRQASVKTLVKYINNQALKEIPDTFANSMKNSVSSVALFEGIPLFNLLRRNKKLTGKLGNEALTKLGETNKAALNKLLHGEGKFFTRLGEYIQSANSSKVKFGEIKSATKIESEIGKLTKKLEKTTGKAADKLKDKISALTEKLGKKTIVETAEQGTKAAGKLGKFGKFGKFMKSSGASFMLIFSGIMEAFTEVLPTFKELGANAGLKQLGKSAIKVVGDTAGFIAGEQLGVTLGTAIGTAICPGIGSAIGAAVGFVGGLAGSFLAGKLTKKITGMTEREKAKEQQEEQAIKDIANNQQAINELKAQALVKILEEAEANNGQLSEDSQQVYNMLLEESENPFVAA